MSSLVSTSRGVISQTCHLLLLLCAFQCTPSSGLESLLCLLLAFLEMPSASLDSSWTERRNILWFCWEMHTTLPFRRPSVALITRCGYYIQRGNYLLICQYTNAYVTLPHMLFTPSGSLGNTAKPGVRDIFTTDRRYILDCL